MQCRLRTASFLALLTWAAFAAPAIAQTPQGGLPTAPAADRASQGGYSSAPASLPGYGKSPLEPYLITWLLPVAGLFSVIVALGVDKRVRAAGHG